MTSADIAKAASAAPLATTLQNRMPAEWETHDRTWMAFPPANATFGAKGSPTLERARTAWATVAQTIARYEPVTVLADPRDLDAARTWLGGGITVIEVPLDDAWLRDSGPTYTHQADGSLSAVDWLFNGWGAQAWASWDNDQNVARAVASAASIPVKQSSLVNEGGGFHVDGQATVLLTETVQLDPRRNPGATKESVEDEIHAALGTTKAIWLPRGLTRDYDEFGTRGHVDIVAAFAGPGTVLLHRQDDPAHPDYAVYLQVKSVLEREIDAQGRPLRLVDVPAPPRSKMKKATSIGRTSTTTLPTTSSSCALSMTQMMPLRRGFWNAPTLAGRWNWWMPGTFSPSAAESTASPSNSPRRLRATGSERAMSALNVVEATITQLRSALKAGEITSEQLVRRYLQRIEEFDSSGMCLNALVVINPEAIEEANASDRRRAMGAVLGPLDAIHLEVRPALGSTSRTDLRWIVAGVSRRRCQMDLARHERTLAGNDGGGFTFHTHSCPEAW